MKRGESGLSLVVGVSKPRGMSSHDVVNRARRIFGERRVGHAGTLDPLAEGALLICVGPATRLDAFLTEHDKSYRFCVTFGMATDTDDAEGLVTRTGTVPARVRDEAFAARFVEGLVGPQRQVPPVYSAIKVGGTRAYQAARAGNVIELAPRDIEIYEAALNGVSEDEAGAPVWDVSVRVSKGTYIRALARDMGAALGCPAHVSRLVRTRAGALDLAECVSLETLEELREQAALDPVSLLGVRFFFVDDSLAKAVSSGAALANGRVHLYERRAARGMQALCACTSGVRESCEPPYQGEIVAAIAENRLKALYEYDEGKDSWKTRCVFSIGVARG